MNRAAVEPVIQAVLYEGYVLYPYRASSCKNRQRWTFGGLYPRAYSEAQSASDPWRMQTQFLIEGGPNALLEAEVGFLQSITREVAERADDGVMHQVEALDIDGRRYQSWQEAIERRVVVRASHLSDLIASPKATPFAFSTAQESETLRDSQGHDAGALIRTQAAMKGVICIHAELVDANYTRVTLTVENHTACDEHATRDATACTTFASTHAVLGVAGGAFVSSIDPPAALAAASASCVNQGCYPVLVGEEGGRSMMLVSPIILYDYPQVAPESAGDLFDGTEIDEILTLRILTMTDEEKREMAAVDDRTRALLARTESLDAQAMAKLHGAWRVLRPPAESEIEPPWAARAPQLAFLRIGNREVKVNDRVRLNPRPGADIMDIALAGKEATIESIERDFEDRVHVAVTIDDDPGRDFGLQRMPGHRFFFAPEEIEPLQAYEA